MHGDNDGGGCIRVDCGLCTTRTVSNVSDCRDSGTGDLTTSRVLAHRRYNGDGCTRVECSLCTSGNDADVTKRDIAIFSNIDVTCVRKQGRSDDGSRTRFDQSLDIVVAFPKCIHKCAERLPSQFRVLGKVAQRADDLGHARPPHVQRHVRASERECSRSRSLRLHPRVPLRLRRALFRASFAAATDAHTT